MKTIKNVGSWIAYLLICIIKFPFTVGVVISLGVETLLILAATKVAKISDSNSLKEAVSSGMNINSNSCIDLSDMYDTFAEELE